MYPYEITARVLRALAPARPLLVLFAAWAFVSALIAIF